MTWVLVSVLVCVSVPPVLCIRDRPDDKRSLLSRPLVCENHVSTGGDAVTGREGLVDGIRTVVHYGKSG